MNITLRTIDGTGKGLERCTVSVNLPPKVDVPKLINYQHSDYLNNLVVNY
jgi:hypothetical protein